MQSVGYNKVQKIRLWSGTLVMLLCLVCRAVQGADAARIITIDVGDYRFQPDTIELRAGEPVRLELTNTDGVTPHNFTLKAVAGELDLDIDIAAGETKIVDLTAPAAGTYTFYCDKKLPFMKSHRDRGMEGVFVVVPADVP
jgi:plastocyanin